VGIALPELSRARGATTRTMSLGAPSKLKKAFGAVKPAATARPCGDRPTRYTVAVYDAGWHKIGKFESMCGAGFLSGKNEPGKPVSVDEGALADLMDAPLVPADALWAISKVEVSNVMANRSKYTVEPSEVAALVGTVAGEQRLAATRPDERCAPSYAVVFKRQSLDVAALAFDCEGSPSGKVTARFRILPEHEGDSPLAKGDIEVDATPFLDLLK
jgi:hypothetical protein